MTSPVQKLRRWCRGLSPPAIADATDRRRAQRYVHWVDHGFLRNLWHNQSEFAPGAWRSNYPDDPRIARLAQMGIRSIITLRGTGPSPFYLLEQESCARHDIALHGVALRSRAAPRKEAMQAMIALFRQVERPLLIHCKSGADRAGLAAAIYLMVIEGEAPDRARRMLSARYIHFRWTRTGVLDMLLDDFAASGVPDFETWLARDYDAAALQARFEAR
jgi:protein tyrosine/serine phosphatase